MPSKLKQMRITVKEELEHIPKGPEPQSELRMVYWSRRMHSLGERAKSRQTAKEVLEECINYLRKDYPNFEFQHDLEFFNDHD